MNFNFLQINFTPLELRRIRTIDTGYDIDRTLSDCLNRPLVTSILIQECEVAEFESCQWTTDVLTRNTGIEFNWRSKRAF